MTTPYRQVTRMRQSGLEEANRCDRARATERECAALRSACSSSTRPSVAKLDDQMPGQRHRPVLPLEWESKKALLEATGCAPRGPAASSCISSACCRLGLTVRNDAMTAPQIR